MPSRDLPARPDLDHLKNEAKALRRAFAGGDADAVSRIEAVLGPRTALRLTEAQRVLAREYGFATWAKLRAHVLAERSVEDAVSAFVAAVMDGNRERALAVLGREPDIATTSLHVAATLGRQDDVRRLAAADPSQAHVRLGEQGADPLLLLCWSPFHGESAERDGGLEASLRALLDAGADPNTRESRYGVSALYFVTGHHSAPRIAKILLEAGANPTDGESVFHAAEKFHEEALDLLFEHGVDLNGTGEWGNTPLWFLLRYYDVSKQPRVHQGVRWLLDHGADPGALSGRERETALHAAVRRRQHPDIVGLLLERGAEPSARRGDGRTPLDLARRSGADAIAKLLEDAGATASSLSRAEELLAACGRGDAATARRLASPDLVASIEDEDLRLLPDAAAEGRSEVVRACLDAGFPIDTPNEWGATALHHAAIQGNAALTRELLGRGADTGIRDPEHEAPPLGWACFGADFIHSPGGDYVGTVRALLEAGAAFDADVHRPADEAVRALIRTFDDAWV